MRKILIVVDMQNDFLTGSLGCNEADIIINNVISKIKQYDQNNVYATKDTHYENYLDTAEGKMLPVRHCIKNTKGWDIENNISELLDPNNIFEKSSFGCMELANHLYEISKNEDIEIELVGRCTDICVISNALILKTLMPNIKIKLDTKSVSGVTKELNDAAIEVMKSCQILCI